MLFLNRMRLFLGISATIILFCAVIYISFNTSPKKAETGTDTKAPAPKEQTVSPAESFMSEMTEDDYISLLRQADFLAVRRGGGFESADELRPEDIFNLYASTPAVQEKINDPSQWIDEGYGFVEIKLSDLEAFVREYFGDYQFDLDGLLECFNANDPEFEDSCMKYDEQNKVILHSTINGGVYWPGGPDCTITVDRTEAEGDLVKIFATRHYTDNDTIDDWVSNVLTVKATGKGGYNFVSFKTEKTQKP